MKQLEKMKRNRKEMQIVGRAKALKKLTVRQAINTAINLAEARLQMPIVRSLPQNVDIVLTKACNLACTFCKDYETLGAKRVSLENFEKVAMQLFPTARWVSICSGGEPYLHKGLEDLLRIAKRYRISSWVLSNGMLLKEERLRTIIREGLITLHGFSVDGMKASTVEAIRVNAKLDVILENIRMLIAIRGRESKQDPGIVIRYALMRSNLEELPAAVQYWGELGINKLECGYLSICNGIDQNESLYFHQDLMKKVFEEALSIASHYPKLDLRLPRTVKEEELLQSSPSRCTAPWSFVNIDTDGRVLPCYRAFEALSMGKVYDEDGEPFGRIWNSEPYQALRRTVNTDGANKYFNYCSRCEYRYGWGDLAPHVGDETWLNLVSITAPDKAQSIDHRRRKAKAITTAD